MAIISQKQIELGPYPRGFHIITENVRNTFPSLPKNGLLHLFIQHTSAGICINEAADPDVLNDFELYFNQLAPEHIPHMRHTLEGLDDMPAHIKSVLSGSELTLPIFNHKLALGTWQGIYLCEFRNKATKRIIIGTLIE